jgi:hypothetical protein
MKFLAKDNVCYYELKKQNPRFDVGCSVFLDERKQAKLQ